MSKIITDQGPNFEANLLKELCKFLKIEKLRTTAYHPQCNGEVERQNRTLKSILAKYVNSNHTDWDLYLNSTLFANNTAVHSSTGKSPYEILFGRTEYGLNDVKFATEGYKSWSNEYLKNMEINRVKNLKQIQHCSQLAKQNQKTYYDQKTNSRFKFTVGSKVWLKNHVTQNGLSRKFTTKWIDPFIVEKVIDELNFVVRQISNGKVYTTHYNRMIPFKEVHNGNNISICKKQESKLELKNANSSKTTSDFVANFELFLYENNLNEQNIVQDQYTGNLEDDSEMTEESEEADESYEPIMPNPVNERSILDLNRSDTSLLNGQDEEEEYQRERENVQDELVRTTRSGRVVQQRRRLLIESNRAKSYF